jgi:hypothetical protein
MGHPYHRSPGSGSGTSQLAFFPVSGQPWPLRNSGTGRSLSAAASDILTLRVLADALDARLSRARTAPHECVNHTTDNASIREWSGVRHRPCQPACADLCQAKHQPRAFALEMIMS